LKRIPARFALACALATGVLLLSAVPASAHEERKVGPYTFVVGWGDEPTYTGFKNNVELTLTDAKTEKPIIDLEDTLDVEVNFGDISTTLTMEPDFVPGAFGEPGIYVAHLTPTRAGEYSFHFTGTIGDEQIDETFTCSEETFGCPVDAQEVQFPAQDPSTAELAGRLERELPRVEQAADSADDDAGGATTLAYAGIGLGAIALILSLVAMARSRKVAR
jgi:hypothetical protein